MEKENKWYKDGSFYIGNFENNKRHGEGKLYFINGDVYIGEFKNDHMEGEGSFPIFS